MTTDLRARIARVALCATAMTGGVFGASQLELARYLDVPPVLPAAPVVAMAPASSHESEALESLVASLTTAHGREAGSDPKNVPRPANSKRVYGAALDDRGTRLAVYAVDRAPEAALETFGAELRRAGFTVVPRDGEGRLTRETFTRPNVRVVVSATRTQQEHTLLSIIEMSAGRT